jgi:hypothetical protein
MSSSSYRVVKTQNVSTSGTSAVTSATVGTPFVRLACTASCYVNFGSSPTATTSSILLNAGTAGEIFKCSPNDKVAGIQVSAGGVLSVNSVDL